MRSMPSGRRAASEHTSSEACRSAQAAVGDGMTGNDSLRIARYSGIFAAQRTNGVAGRPPPVPSLRAAALVGSSAVMEPATARPSQMQRLGRASASSIDVTGRIVRQRISGIDRATGIVAHGCEVYLTLRPAPVIRASCSALTAGARRRAAEALRVIETALGTTLERDRRESEPSSTESAMVASGSTRGVISRNPRCEMDGSAAPFVFVATAAERSRRSEAIYRVEARPRSGSDKWVRITPHDGFRVNVESTSSTRAAQSTTRP